MDVTPKFIIKGEMSMLGSVKANHTQIGVPSGSLTKIANSLGFASKAEEAYEDKEASLAQLLAEAVEEHIEKITRGLNALTDEEIEEKIAEFKAKFYPENGTPEQLAAFEEKLARFTKMLQTIQDRQSTESLLVSAAEAAGEEMDGFAQIIRSRINAAQNAPQSL